MAKNYIQNILNATDTIVDPFFLIQCGNNASDIDKPVHNTVFCKYITVGDLDKLPVNTTTFSFLQVNCRSIRKNFPSLINQLSNMKMKLSAIALTETWLEKGEYIFFFFPHYDLISVPRPTGRDGGWDYISTMILVTATLIDNIFVRGLCGVDDINASLIFDDLSDHFLILVHLNIGCKVPNLTCKYYKTFL